MSALAEPCLHSGGQRNCMITKLVPQAIGGRKRLVPFVMYGPAIQAELFALLVKVSGMNAKQPHGSVVPIGAKQLANRGEHFRIN